MPICTISATNLIQDGTDAQQTAAEAGLKAAAGWYIDLQAADGEKALARAVTIAGKVYFTTFSPVIDNENLCVPAPAEPAGCTRCVCSTPRAAVDFSADEPTGRPQRDAGLPDSRYAGAALRQRQEDPLAVPLRRRLAGAGNPFDTGAQLREPFGTYWYNQEY
jgi:hypothetical protein